MVVDVHGENLAQASFSGNPFASPGLLSFHLRGRSVDSPGMTESLVINEIYLSLQGESTFAGLPCIFVRLTGCDLRCSYCDTAYAFKEGHRQTLEFIENEVNRLAIPYSTGATLSPRLPLVELTGGEPLLQHNAPALMARLCERGWTVLLETSGAHDIGRVDARVHRIVDLKCPSSGETSRIVWANLPQLRPSDEIKFVIATEEDYQWAKGVVETHGLAKTCPILFSWAAPLTADQRDPSLKAFPRGMLPLSRRELVERIVADALPVRFQVQMHKVIWAPDERSV